MLYHFIRTDTKSLFLNKLLADDAKIIAEDKEFLTKIEKRDRAVSRSSKLIHRELSDNLSQFCCYYYYSISSSKITEHKKSLHFPGKLSFRSSRRYTENVNPCLERALKSRIIIKPQVGEGLPKEKPSKEIKAGEKRERVSCTRRQPKSDWRSRGGRRGLEKRGNEIRIYTRERRRSGQSVHGTRRKSVGQVKARECNYPLAAGGNKLKGKRVCLGRGWTSSTVQRRSVRCGDGEREREREQRNRE